MVLSGTSPLLIHGLVNILSSTEEFLSAGIFIKYEEILKLVVRVVLGLSEDESFKGLFRRNVESPMDALKRIIQINNSVSYQPKEEASQGGWDVDLDFEDADEEQPKEEEEESIDEFLKNYLTDVIKQEHDLESSLRLGLISLVNEVRRMFIG